MPSIDSPLTNIEEEGDKLKISIDQLVPNCESLNGLEITDKQTKRKQLLKRNRFIPRCKELISSVMKLEKKVSKLKKSQEPSSTTRFDEKKRDEANRLASFKIQLEGIKSTMEADEVEEDYLKNYEENNNLDDSNGSDSTESPSKEEVENQSTSSSKKTPSPNKSKLSRFGIFRRSKSPVKGHSKMGEVEGKTGMTEKNVRQQPPNRNSRSQKKEENPRESKNRLGRKEKILRSLVSKKQNDDVKKTDLVGRDNGTNSASGGNRSNAQQMEEEIGEETSEEDSEDEESGDDSDCLEEEEAEEGVIEDQRPRRMDGGLGSTSKMTSRKQKELDSAAPILKKGVTTFAKGMNQQPGNDDDSSYVDSEEPESEYEEDGEDEESDDDIIVGGVPPGSSKGQQGSSEGHLGTGPTGEHVGQIESSRGDPGVEDEDDESLEDEEEEYETEEDDEEEEGEFEDEEEGETGSSDEEEEGQLPPEGENLFVVLCDFEAEEPADLAVKQGNIVTILNTREDGWWMAEDEEGNKGLVPSTYLKLKRDSDDSQSAHSQEPDQDADEATSPRGGKQLWKSVRKTVNETTTTASDVLSAMGAIPAGFRQSTTAKLLTNDQNKLGHCLKPKLSESGLSFRDLLWDPQSRQLRAVPCRIQKMLTLVMVRNMPAVGIGLETKCRHARIAIFDGKEVLSNIHTVQATWNEADLKTWRFSPRVSGILPSILDGECFIRTDRSEKNIGLLIELCVSYVRTRTGEQGELSCGWVHLPLYSEETGGPIINKLYELPVQGGTPFEQGVEVDPTISRKASTSKFRSMLTSNKQPRVHIKFAAPTKEQKLQLEMLPLTIVSVGSYLTLLTFYRKILADAVLRDRIDVRSTELIHNPLLANFSKAADLPDVMDGLRSMWNEKMRSTKKSEKRDSEQMKSLFNSAFLESAYPVLHSASIPPYKWPDIESEQLRWESISNFTAASHQKGILASLLSPGKLHTPFHTSEVSFDVLGAYTSR